MDEMGLRTEYAYLRNVLVKQFGEERYQEIEDLAREKAISLIVDGGYDSQDSDLLGEPMGDAVQTALMIAFMRQPDMVDSLDEKGI